MMFWHYYLQAERACKPGLMAVPHHPPLLPYLSPSVLCFPFKKTTINSANPSQGLMNKLGRGTDATPRPRWRPTTHAVEIITPQQHSIFLLCLPKGRGRK